MPIAIPNLDDMTWEDLVKEGRSLIPARAPEWTNHNPSDPGITLIELLAYFTEILVYRANRISDTHVLEFLRLINGPGWTPVENLSNEKQKAIDRLLHIRLVTTVDYERLLMANTDRLRLSSGESVARVKCVAETDLDRPDQAPHPLPAAGHLSVVVLTNQSDAPSKELLRRVKHFLEPARMLTARLHVVPPRYAIIGIHATLVLRPDADAEATQNGAIDRIETFFDPLEGGPDRKGWSFGRSVYVYEVYRLLQEIPGVEYVRRNMNLKTGAEMSELAVPVSERWRERFNDLHEIEAVQLLPHELVRITVNRDSILIAQERRTNRS